VGCAGQDGGVALGLLTTSGRAFTESAAPLKAAPRALQEKDIDMPLDQAAMRTLIAAAAERIIAAAPELTSLDQAIGDGDHGINMKRGSEAVLGKIDAIAAQPPGVAIKDVGRTLVMTVGGASGPLYGSFFMAFGEAIIAGKRLPEDLADIFAAGVAAVAARGKSKAGEKTMLDVMFPVLAVLRDEAGRSDLTQRLCAVASDAAEKTAPMLATKGRASFLGPRSIGHVDPGARSSCILVHAVCEALEKLS
jgi:dihydroxyacetone kinase-like protein